MLDKLHLLDEYKYYFQFTLNSYDHTIEKNVPQKSILIQKFIELSKKIGKDKVIWRYDPILLSAKFNKEYHYKYFEYLVDKLCSYTNKCVISFIDPYTKTERNLKGSEIESITKEDMNDIAGKLVKIANMHNIVMETCSEEIDLGELNINHGKCIDDKLISEIIGSKLNIEKDKNQRESCGCVSSIDVGAYNTCNHNCLYCYANFSRKTVEKNMQLHNCKSPLILGEIEADDKITERDMKSLKATATLFD